MTRAEAPLDDAAAATQPLPHLDALQRSFGVELSHVRVATGQDEALRPLHADAATDGATITFASAHPTLEEAAHEVAHLLQADHVPQAGQLASVSAPQQAGEREAESAAREVARGEPVSPLRQTRPATISRKASEGEAGDGWWNRTVDWGVGLLSDRQDDIASEADGIPILDPLADAGAWLNKQTLQFGGGVLKGAGDMIGGVVQAVSHPIDTLNGLRTVAEHLPVLPGVPNPLKVVRLSEEVMRGETTPGDAFNALLPHNVVRDDAEFWYGFGALLLEPYAEAWEDGRYAEVFGRGLFDVVTTVGTGGVLGGGAKGVSTGGRFSRLLSKVEDVSSVSSKLDGVTNVTSKLDEVTSATSKLDEVTSTTSKLDDQVEATSKVDDVIDETSKGAGAKSTGGVTDDATRQHVHQGEIETAPNSPYRKKWNKQGLHDWDGLVKRCLEDGYEILDVIEDPVTGVRRVKIRRHGIDPKTKQPVSGVFNKTIYPKKLTPDEIDELGEAAYHSAVKGDDGTRLTDPGASMKRDGTPVDGYFSATVTMPDGAPIQVEGWFKTGTDGKPVITSHAPAYKNDWPSLPSSDW
jgi:hypothetical protein